MPVAAPAAFSALGRVAMSLKAVKWSVPWHSPYMPFSWVGMPLKRDAREGEQLDTEVKARSKVTPQVARRLMCGVGSVRSPYGPD